MTDQAWLARYNARKTGQPPQQQPPPQQPYGAPPPVPGYYPYQSPPPAQGYAPPPPPGYSPPPPAGPPHAPFGYDPTTGTPVAPYGRDQYGNIITYVQTPPPMQGYPQQSMHDQRGQVMPMGYGQPPYGQPGQQPGLAQQQTLFTGEDGQIHVDWSQAPKAWQGGRGTEQAQSCPNCHSGFLVSTSASGEGARMNINTGVMAYPAPHCSACGFVQKSDGVSMTPGEATGAMVNGVRVQQGAPQMAPGARTVAQAASQHGLPNLFAPAA